MSLPKLNPVEPPWYVTRMPGGVGGAAPRGAPLSRSISKITYFKSQAFQAQNPFSCKSDYFAKPKELPTLAAYAFFTGDSLVRPFSCDVGFGMPPPLAMAVRVSPNLFLRSSLSRSSLTVEYKRFLSFTAAPPES